MTSPNADQNVNSHLGGTDPNTGAILGYQFNAECLGRVTYSSNDAAGPYTEEFVPNNPVVGSAATYDQVAAMNKLLGSRHIDPRGNMVNPKKAWLVQWYWFQDGCPTPLPLKRLQQYIAWADKLRPWPETAIAAFNAVGYKMPASEGPAYDYSNVKNAPTLDEAVAEGPQG